MDIMTFERYLCSRVDRPRSLKTAEVQLAAGLLYATGHATKAVAILLGYGVVAC